MVGTGVLAGLVTFSLPGSGPQDAGTTIGAAAPPAASPSAPPLAEAERQRALDAYFAAGYGYQDAAALAKIWRTSADVTAVKVRAGEVLLHGQALPVRPQTPPPPTVPAADTAAVKAFFARGYSYQDAVQLAKIWHLPTPWDAKLKAGRRLEQGQTVPVRQ